jgi:hypothetical protein
MKKLLTLLFLIGTIGVMTTNVCGQNRENRQNHSFIQKTERVISATGWAFNDKTGKWVENKNVIYDKPNQTNWISHLPQNFYWIQFTTIQHEGITYYVLLYENRGGYYKYPSIHEGWEEENRTHFFIIDSKNYNKIKDIVNSKQQKSISIRSELSGHIDDALTSLGGEYLYNEDNLLAKITTTINNQHIMDYERCLVVNSQQVQGKDVIRFRLPEACPSSSLGQWYFEIELDEFKKLLTL